MCILGNYKVIQHELFQRWCIALRTHILLKICSMKVYDFLLWASFGIMIILKGENEWALSLTSQVVTRA